MPGVIKTTAPISADQRAVIDKYGFEVDTKDGSWYVNDDVAFRKNSLKDASKKGRYVGKTLDETLKQAVEVRREINGEKPDAEAPADDEGETTQKPNTKKPDAKAAAKAAKAKAKEAKADAKAKAAAAPKQKKPKKERGDGFGKRAFRVILDNPELLNAIESANSKEERAKAQQALASKVSDISLASAGHVIRAWFDLVPLLTEKGWLKRPAGTPAVVRTGPVNKKAPAAAAAVAEPAPEPAPTPKAQPVLRKKTKAA